MKSLRLAALMLLAACGSSAPIVTAPVDVTNAGAATEYNGPAPTDEVARLRVPVTGAEPSRGPDSAKVTIVIFSDFECPFCSRVRPALDQVMATYGDNVRLVWRNTPLPFHERARPAAAFAMEAFQQRGDEGFWAAHDLIFLNQRALLDEDLMRYAGQLGLNQQGVTAALAGAHDASIDADIAMARQLGVRGTPAFVINGEKLMGAQPFEAFQEVIDRAMAAADFVIAGGAAPAHVYDALMQHASDAAVEEAPRVAPPSAPRAGRPDSAAVYNVPIAGTEPTRGAANALVSIVVFSDFQCPFCGRLEPTFTELLRRYPNDLRIVWMNHPLPFHQEAMPAAQAALEAMDQGGNAQFWAYHEKLFANQRALTRPDLERYAGEVGLNMAQFNAALDNNEHRAVIDAQTAVAERLGARGTPASFVNGRHVGGAVPASRFITVIDEEIARARAAIASGTPRAGIYAAMTSNGLTAVAPSAPAPAAAPSGPGPEHDYGIAVPASAPSRGSASGQIVIQTFSDFQCPFCSRVLPTVERIMQQYGNRVRFVWRNYPLPFHRDAHLAAQAAMEVFQQRGDAGFWAYHDLLFANQRALGRAELETYAAQVGGVDMTRFRAALDSRTHAAAVDADMDAVRQAGARIGTPSFFINGRLLQGAQPFEAFRVAIDRELAR